MVKARARFLQSVGLTPAARTATSNSLGPGTGLGMRTSLSTSGEPWASWLMARIVVVLGFVMRPASLPPPFGAMA
jgi:hypothetical protein